MIQITSTGIMPQVFTSFFIPIVEAFSGQPSEYPMFLHKVPEGLRDYLANLYTKLGIHYPVWQRYPAPLPKYNIPPSNRVLVGFSGGKDGLAAAIILKEKGYDVTLYHLLGINRTYKYEVENAKLLAASIGLPLIIEDIKITGKQAMADHPFKNQLIICKMLDYGAPNGFGNYCLGNHEFETMAGANVNVEFSDSGEQIKLFDNFIRQFVPNYQRETLLKNNEEALKIILAYNPNLINLVASCVFPPYRKPMMRKYIVKHFGPDVLLDNRCGAYCYKCTREYLLLSKWGTLPHSPGMAEKCQNWITTHPETLYI